LLREMLKSKIHRAKVTETNVDYVGSLTVDRRLLQAADIFPYEKVHVVNTNNGSRFVTYVIESERQGEICVNGAAARLAEPGDKIIIMAYGHFSAEELKEYSPAVVHVGEGNILLES
jgi:aspartate 1-decarboxylase